MAEYTDVSPSIYTDVSPSMWGQAKTKDYVMLGLVSALDTWQKKKEEEKAKKERQKEIEEEALIRIGVVPKEKYPDLAEALKTKEEKEKQEKEQETLGEIVKYIYKSGGEVPEDLLKKVGITSPLPTISPKKETVKDIITRKVEQNIKLGLPPFDGFTSEELKIVGGYIPEKTTPSTQPAPSPEERSNIAIKQALEIAKGKAKLQAEEEKRKAEEKHQWEKDIYNAIVNSYNEKVRIWKEKLNRAKTPQEKEALKLTRPELTEEQKQYIERYQMRYPQDFPTSKPKPQPKPSTAKKKIPQPPPPYEDAMTDAINKIKTAPTYKYVIYNKMLKLYPNKKNDIRKRLGVQ